MPEQFEQLDELLSFSSPWARAWGDHEVVDLAVGRLALHDAEENPDEVLAALDDKTEAVIRMLTSHAPTRTSLLSAGPSRRARHDRLDGAFIRPHEAVPKAKLQVDSP